MSRLSRREGEQGVTLIELLLAVVILGVIAVPLTSSVIVGLKTTDNTTRRLTNGNSADFVATYFARDVRNSVGLTQGTSSCATSAILNVDAGGGTTISYLSPTGATLLRRVCPSSGAATTKTLASELDPSQPPAVVPNPLNDIAHWKSVRLDFTGKSAYTVHLSVTKRTT